MIWKESLDEFFQRIFFVCIETKIIKLWIFHRIPNWHSSYSLTTERERERLHLRFLIFYRFCIEKFYMQFFFLFQIQRQKFQVYWKKILFFILNYVRCWWSICWLNGHCSMALYTIAPSSPHPSINKHRYFGNFTLHINIFFRASLLLLLLSLFVANQ